MRPVYIKPVDQSKQTLIVCACEQYVEKAAGLYGKSFAMPAVTFDLKGKTAGIYQVKKTGRVLNRRIRINPWLAAKYFSETLADTVPHEVAHFIVDCLYGLKNVRPHGPEWKAVMLDFGVQPQVRGNYSLDGIPVKQYQRFEYTCQCQTHWLTHLRHKKVLRSQAKYLCRSCGGQLRVSTPVHTG